MKNYDADDAKYHFIIPDNVIKLPVDTQSGLLPVAGQSTRDEVFLQGTQPTQFAANPDEDSAQNWMIRQIQTQTDNDAQDVGSDEDEF